MKKILSLLIVPVYISASLPMRLKKLEEERTKQRRNYFVNITRKNILDQEVKHQTRKQIPVNIPIKKIEVIKAEYGIIIVEE